MAAIFCFGLELEMNKVAVMTLVLILGAGLFATQANAQGDAEAGGKLFKRVCGGCHQIGESARAFWSAAQRCCRTGCRQHHGLSVLRRDEIVGHCLDA